MTKPARQRARQSPRPGCIAQALPSEQGTGMPRGFLFGTEQVGRIRARSLERQAESEDDANARRSCGTRSPRSTRTAWPSPTRRRKAFEKTLSPRLGKPGRRRGPHPHLRESQGRSSARCVLQVQLFHTTKPSLRQERMLRIVQILEGDAGEKSSALAVALQATTESPVESLGARSRPALGRGDPENGRPWRKCTKRRCHPLQGDASLPLLATLARCLRKKSWPTIPWPSNANKQVLAIAPSHEAGSAGA